MRKITYTFVLLVFAMGAYSQNAIENKAMQKNKAVVQEQVLPAISLTQERMESIHEQVKAKKTELESASDPTLKAALNAEIQSLQDEIILIQNQQETLKNEPIHIITE